MAKVSQQVLCKVESNKKCDINVKGWKECPNYTLLSGNISNQLWEKNQLLNL